MTLSETSYSSDAQWFYMSFADPERPTGTQFLGGCYVQGLSERDAYAHMLSLGFNPGGEVMIVPLPPGGVDEYVPVENRNRLLTAEEVNPEDDDVA